MNKIDLQPMIGLGFTNLEAEIYTCLVQHSPATGYKVAKEIGKPVANTYKAIESLHKKGAIIIDNSSTRLCRAVDIDELLDNLKNRVTVFSEQAKNELSKLTSSQTDNKIYQLRSVDQIFARLRNMLSNCKRVAILDLFPNVVEKLRENILEASDRGVKITLKVYEPIGLPGINIEVGTKGKTVVQRWPGTWANGVFDGEEYLLAFISKDLREVYQAVWSNNHYLSWVYYSAIVQELKSTALESAINAKKSNKELRKILSHYSKMEKLKSTGYKNAPHFFENNSNKF
ncbi:MAG: TrmB family transcriptional regulator [candidate division Zixibacteria bacterium]|nr:TrmB family transcriptional regulator [candidate division Zixibacteria bacterium]